ncbi:MAG: signal peptidase I [Nevskia sp.]|nr:signal peptidase I [Nevskia sp.]
MNQWIRNNRGLLVLALLLGLVRSAVADWNRVPSGSMRPTILEGDVVLVNRLAYDFKLPLTQVVLARVGEPRRGDIVTFYSPQNGHRLIKRLVALPGDSVEMRDKTLIVNGRAASYAPVATVLERVAADTVVHAVQLDEKTADGERIVQWLSLPGASRRDSFGPLRVAADRYLMLGDNRDNSADSRYFGLVPRELLIGRAVTVLVSADITGNWMPRFARFGRTLD